MEIDEILDHCIAKPGAYDDFPFGEDTLVLKVSGKMFALTNLSRHPLRINLKCDPQRALQLRERYDAIEPGYHMNKRHWNTLTLDGSLPASLLAECLDHSYELVVAGLTRAQRASLTQTDSDE